MKITNFRDFEMHGKGSLIGRFYTARVDVETGLLWWKKKREATIRREYIGYWHFVDSGQFTPGRVVEALERSYKAERDLRDE